MCRSISRSVVVGLAIAVFMVAAPAHATTLISVDLFANGATNYSGVEPSAAAAQPAMFGAANVWNGLGVGAPYPTKNYDGASFTNLVDSTGAATSVGLTILPGPAGTAYTANGDHGLGVDHLRGNWLRMAPQFGDPEVCTEIDWSITGLAPNQYYAMWNYCAEITGYPVGSFAMLTDTNGDGSLTDETAVKVNVHDGVLCLGKTDSAGKLIGQVGPDWYHSPNLGESDWAGFQLTATSAPTPEPSAAVLAITGLVALLAYAWRKRK
jgi:hypothetical protein